jgi:hypothetical protein
MSNSTESTSSTNIPSVHTLAQAAKLGLEFDKPIMLDYYVTKSRIVKTKDGDTLLYKNNDEYTSPIGKLFKVDKSQKACGTSDLIAMSENSIYVVTSDVLQKN